MKFWLVTAYNKQAMREESVYVHASHDHDQLVELLAEVHPEWEKIKAKVVKKPAHIQQPWIQ